MQTSIAPAPTQGPIVQLRNWWELRLQKAPCKSGRGFNGVAIYEFTIYCGGTYELPDPWHTVLHMACRLASECRCVLQQHASVNE